MSIEDMGFLQLISKIFRHKQTILDKTMKKYDLSNGSLPYLLNLEHAEGISQINLSKKMHIDKAMTARTVSKLIAQGLIENVKDEQSGWSYRLYLTPKSKAILPMIHQEMDGLLATMSDSIPEEDLQVTLQTLRKMYTHLYALSETGETHE